MNRAAILPQGWRGLVWRLQWDDSTGVFTHLLINKPDNRWQVSAIDSVCVSISHSARSGASWGLSMPVKSLIRPSLPPLVQALWVTCAQTDIGRSAFITKHLVIAPVHRPHQPMGRSRAKITGEHRATRLRAVEVGQHHRVTQLLADHPKSATLQYTCEEDGPLDSSQRFAQEP